MTRLALVNAFALAAALAWLASVTLPATRAIRVRNAFLLRRGAEGDFGWTPDNVPKAFRREQASPPPSIVRALDVEGIRRIEGDWPRALALTGMLVRHARADAPIRADLATTYAGIVAGGGYCADFVRVYLAAASAVGLFCRQWAFSFDGFGGHGHTVVEVWDGARRQWAMIDVHNNFFAVNRGGNVPLDVAALRHALSSAPQTIEFRRAAEGRLGYPHAHKLLDYYRRGASQWYLWFGNDVVTRERKGFAGVLARVSAPVAHRLSSALGGLPPIMVPVSADNIDALSRMERLRARIRMALAVVAALATLLLWQGLRADA